MNRSTLALLVIALVCLCATLLCALGELPSEAATAILGGAVVQVVQLARARRDSVAPPALPSGSPGSEGDRHTPVGPIVGMLGGGLAGHLASFL